MVLTTHNKKYEQRLTPNIICERGFQSRGQSTELEQTVNLQWTCAPAEYLSFKWLSLSLRLATNNTSQEFTLKS